jgi:Mce-associated membrane protein
VTDQQQQDLHAPARPEVRPEAGPGAPVADPDRTRLRRTLAVVFAVVAALALILLVVEVVALRPRADEADARQDDRSAAVRAAERFTVQVNNYDVASIDDYQSSITPLLSPKFKGEFEKAMSDIVTSVKQSKMTSEGRVLTSGVSSLDPDSAQVLVVSDASVKTVFDRRARHFRWEVSLVKIDDRWLVDNFTPVA